MKDTFNVGVKHSIFNNELRKRRLSLGLSQKELSQASGVTITAVGNLETFRRMPSEKEATQICRVLDTDISTVFPEWLKLFKPKRTTVVTEHLVTEVQLTSGILNQYLLEDGQDQIDKVEEDIMNEELKEVIKRQLSSLTPRESKILTMRFGLDGSNPKTLEEVGNQFGVTRERIRGIESKAIRRLKHPTRSKYLKSYLQ